MKNAKFKLRRWLVIAQIAAICAPGMLHCSSAAAASFEPGLDETAGGAGRSNCVSYAAAVYNPGTRNNLRPVYADAATPTRFDRAEFDDGSFWNPRNPSRFTVPDDGLYALRLRVNFEIREDLLHAPAPERRLIFKINDREARSRTYADPHHEGGYWPTLESETRLHMRAGQFATIVVARNDESDRELFMSGVDLTIRRLCD